MGSSPEQPRNEGKTRGHRAGEYESKWVEMGKGGDDSNRPSLFSLNPLPLSHLRGKIRVLGRPYSPGVR